MLRANNSSWPVDASELKEGLITVKGHTKVGEQTGSFLFPVLVSCTTCLLCPSLQRVSEGALSPDGTVLATASYDGFIKFWQIYIEGGQDKPR